MVAKLFYQGNTLISVVAGEGASRYVRTKEVILCERTDNTSPAVLACELGGTVSVVASSNKMARFRYTPYGRRFELLSEATQLGFNGEYLFLGVEIYLLGNGYRAYNPDTMRFLSPDSISPFQILNAYSYCGNDPVNNSDPSGHIGQSHLIKLKARVNDLKAGSAKMRASVTSVDKLGSATRLRDADIIVSGAKKLVQKAYVEAAPAYEWLSGKLENKKYADRADFILGVLRAHNEALREAYSVIDMSVDMKAEVWARNEAKFNVMVQEVKSSVNNDAPQPAMSNVRAGTEGRKW